MKNLDFKIEKSTMRELSQFETNDVVGGTTPTFPLTITTGPIVTRITTVVTTLGGDDDIFDDGFEP